MKSFIPFVGLAALANAGTTIWNGSFNAYNTAADFDTWSWSNQVGEYQWYIHGSSSTSSYLALGPTYKNPADTAETHGLKLTIDSTSHWNGQTMQRTEIIPQTTANLGTGTAVYHFSISHTATNPPDTTVEHQIVFFESHFTELKIGVGSDTTALQWFAGGTSRWSTAFTAGTWYNFAYEINFSSSTVALWASTGGNPLTKVVSAVSASASTNSADWHLGVLAFGSKTEDWYFSGVYVESGSVTTSVGSGSTGGTTTPSTTPSGPTTTTSSTSVSSGPTTTTTSTGPKQTQWGQCGGNGYTGPTACASPFSCVAVSPPYYYQCQ